MRRLALVLVVLVIFTATLAATASAGTHVVVQHNATLLRHFEGLTDCQAYGYAFTFTGDYVVRRSDVQYFDSSGNLVKR
jgi:hypothetical protein